MPSAFQQGNINIHASLHSSGGSDAISHNNLASPDGGTTGEYYHLTHTQYDDLTDGGETTLHSHAAGAPGHADVIILNVQSSAPSTLEEHGQVYDKKTVTEVPGAKVSNTMSGDSTPSPTVVSASGIYSAGYEAYKAFDTSDTSYWVADTNNSAWLRYDSGSGNTLTVAGYRIYINASLGPANAPKDFTFQGSSNGSSWTTLDTQTGVTYTMGTEKSFSISSSTYRYFRINITAVGTLNNQPGICRFSLYSPTTYTTTYDHCWKDETGVEHILHTVTY